MTFEITLNFALTFGPSVTARPATIVNSGASSSQIVASALLSAPVETLYVFGVAGSSLRVTINSFQLFLQLYHYASLQ